MKKTLVTVACAVSLVVSLSVLPNTLKIGPFGVDTVSAATGTTTTTTTTTTTSTSTSSSSSISGTMRLGSKGSNVRALQTFLKNGGYNLKVDGDFGKVTLAAVKDFQGKNGLAVDGIVAQQTRAKINAIIAASKPATTASTAPTLKLGSKGDAVKELQTNLNKNGFNLKVDGIFGQGTLTAVKSFQKAKGLSADGIVGPKTNAVLFPAAAPAPTTPAPTTPAPTTPVDTVSAASVTDNAVAFEKAMGTSDKDGKWIIAATKDLTYDHAITLNGNFTNGKIDKNTGLKVIQRKIALYTQDDKRNVTARFTLTAPKITILSINASIQHGTVKGDIYVSAPNFKLVDTVVEGNVYFTNIGAQKTFEMDSASYVRGKKELKALPETTVEGVDAYTSASKVIDNAAFEKAISSTAEAGGKWIIATLDNLKFDKELVVEGEFKNTKTPPAVARKIAIYAHPKDDPKPTTARFILEAPKLTIKSPEANITKGLFKGDVYVTVPNFKLVDAIVDGNIYFSTQEAMVSFKKLTDATSIVTGKMEVK